MSALRLRAAVIVMPSSTVIRRDRTGGQVLACENFLYDFKAAPRGCAARRSEALLFEWR
jgi:hypothetical protein